MIRHSLAIAALALLAACQPPQKANGVPGSGGANEVFDAIAADDVLRFTGTEPFWGGEARAAQMTWTTPERPEGVTIAVSRFAGRGGLSFSGTLDGAPLLLAATPARCSDGMSDRTYPFAVTVQVGEQTLRGCGWTDRQPFTGPEAP